MVRRKSIWGQLYRGSIYFDETPDSLITFIIRTELTFPGWFDLRLAMDSHDES